MQVLNETHVPSSGYSRAAKHHQRDRNRLQVRWYEPKLRYDFDAEYVTVGSLPGLLKRSFENDDTIRKLLCDSVILSRQVKTSQPVSQHTRLVSAIILKLLQRGRMPLPTLEIEQAAIDAFDLTDSVNDLGKTTNIELGWESETGNRYNIDRSEFIHRLAEKRTFKLEADFQDKLLDSQYEERFITRWVTENLGDSAAHWICPQAPLDALKDSSPDQNADDFKDQRVDFIAHPPCGASFAIEIDGPEHMDALNFDTRRDHALKRSTNMDVIRVPNRELELNEGPNLNQIKKRFLHQVPRGTVPPISSNKSGNRKIADFARACSIGSKIQSVIAQAVNRGWLTGDEWNLEITGGGPTAAGAVLDVLRMYSALDLLYGGKSGPVKCRIRTQDGDAKAWCIEAGEWSEIENSEFEDPNLKILVESDSSPFDQIAHRDVDIIIRPAFLPIEFRTDLPSDFPRQPIVVEDFETAEPALTFFLRNVFRKQSFREGQGIAIWRTLRQQDTVVLLPTGGGKSIIYQLSGLLMPGITMVIDPIVALIEDQIDVLHRYGIDRATGISSALNHMQRGEKLKRAEQGEFQFILMAPERLQSPEFRRTVRSLCTSSLVNLAVIDEAHCVSEWGHEFRPAYLRLADTLRSTCTDQFGKAPPLLALTGTASRAVLKDMMIELGIDQSQSDNVVRPTTFDRPELKFEIHRTETSKEGMDVLRGVVKSMPQKFGDSSTRFFRSRGYDTSSGIVFVRTVNAEDWGLMATKDAVAKVTDAPVVAYSGSIAPNGVQDWEVVKREYAREFKENKAPILVATTAFGMGIDKPNIRFVVHNGMPGSIESFYQEAGRAGRDGKDAWCVVVTSEFDEVRSNRMLDPNASIEEIRSIHQNYDNDWDHMDDVTSVIYFHIRSFQGVEVERELVNKVLHRLGDLNEHQTVNITGDNKEHGLIEKAIVRLVRTGIVADYTIDWSKRQFLLDVPRFDFGLCKSKTIKHVELAQPSRSRAFAAKIEAIPDTDPKTTAASLVSELIKFTYDVIERSRRRAILEAFNLARNAKGDQSIRQRILEYLQEGVHADRIDELLASTQPNLDDWWEIIEKTQTAVDAGELRGLTVRRVESYSYDPGLLFTRAASESMCSDRDDGICIRDFSSAIRFGITNLYQTECMMQMICNLYRFAATRAEKLDPLLTMGLLELEPKHAQYEPFRFRAFAHAKKSDNPETKTVGATFALYDAVDAASDTADAMVKRYTAKSLRLLGAGKE